ncbi:TetR/AcrR family transcriptional regulator [Acinetobacter sp. YH16032]|uniref:TetR/AcrR family transcriptional regulator n=1 Tax=Acinetobacter sp. YH16032 TaxID=2601181 RepID=UPI0015D21C64|nr:TetR/AcrR family transcriptional regulator [Acinetobacter sp. YH16032]
MASEDKSARRRSCILASVKQALNEVEYHQLTVEDIASRAGVGKSTIYRWWSHKSELVLDTFKELTLSIFEFEPELDLEQNLNRQLLRLAKALDHPVGRAMLVVMANHRELAATFFKQYLLPKRVQLHQLIQQAIEAGELIEHDHYDLVLDRLYGPIHYQIIFFNHLPDEHYIRQLVKLSLDPLRPQAQTLMRQE